MASRVLGFSGLAKSREFKEAALPCLSPAERRIYQGADAAAAIVVAGHTVAAAAQERFDGAKHSERFPGDAIRFCLGVAGVSLEDLDVVAHSFAYEREKDFYESQPGFYRKLYREVLSPEVNQRIAEQALGVDLSDKYVSVPHHFAHAASAYFPSGFGDSLLLVSDGLGERHSATVLSAHSGGFDVLARVPAHSSLGLLYGLFTMYLGFTFGDGEYKVMGLAPYGNADRYLRTILDNWVSLEPDGRYAIPLLLANSTDLDKETYRPAMAVLEDQLGPRRAANDPIEQRHKDIAAALQAVLELAQMHILGYFASRTGHRRLCLAGGVALNCVANGIMLRSRLFDDVFVQPAAGDDGAALGAAQYAAHAGGEVVAPTMNTAWGPSYGTDECARALAGSAGLSVQRLAPQQLYDTVSEALARQLIVGWFKGRMEFGPRALGNRSILADPRCGDMRERINQLVKKRESFRPFAPAVTAEAAPTYFELDPEDARLYRHMLYTTYVRIEHRDALPAVTHVDGSARVQTVFRDDGAFWNLLCAFGERTGVPILLNTSFNVAGQPIVRTPEQAVATFLDAKLDMLVLEDLVIRSDR